MIILIKVEILDRPQESMRLLRIKENLKNYIERANNDVDKIGDFRKVSYKKFNFLPIRQLDKESFNHLIEEFNNRCAYCETVLDTAYIDNIMPKTLYPQLAYEWENLLPVCPTCSFSKRDLFPVEETNRVPLLLNPRIDNPEEHLQFLYNGEVLPKSVRGEVTIKTLNLNREVLIKRRLEYFKHLEANKDLFGNANWIEFCGIVSHVAIRRSFIFNEFSLTALWSLSLSKRSDLLEFLSLNSNMNKSEFKDIYNSYRFKKENLIIETEDYNIVSQYIQSFKIENLSGLNFEYNFKFSEKTPFLMILGENGTGKTSLLQTMVISATRNVSKPRGFAKRFKNGRLAVTYGNLEDIESLHIIDFNKGSRAVNLSKEIPIAAYGATRLIDNDYRQKTIMRSQNVSNIFPISNNSYFLPKLVDWANEEDIELIQEALVEIFPVESDDSVYLMYKEEEKEFLVTFDAVTYYQFSELSSGYKTIVGLVVDIMRFLLSQPNNSGRYTPAIILIDEIDVHLHPSWKIRVVDLFRRTFPHVQFIMTTHDPLCLRGLEENEIIVFKKVMREGKISVLTENVPFQGDLKIDQILLSDLFGLESTLDPKHEEEINSEYNLSTDSKFKYYGYSPTEQIALKIIDEAIQEKKIKLNEDVNEIDEDIKAAVLRLWGLDD